jgi:hypothetical protein
MTVVTNGLQFYWNSKGGLTGGSLLGNLAPSGQPLGLSLVGGIAQDPADGSLVLNGSSGYLSVNPSSRMPSLGESWTMELLFTPQNISSPFGLFGGSTYGASWVEAGYSDIYQDFYNNGWTSPHGVTIAVPEIRSNSLIHLTYRFNSANKELKILVNNNPVHTEVLSSNITFKANLETLTIGTESRSDDFAPIKFHLMRFYNRSLSDTELLQNFNEQTNVALINNNPSGSMIATGQFTIHDLTDITVSSTPPSNPVVDMMWLDTSVTPNQLKRWNGSTWVMATPSEPGDIGAEDPEGSLAKAFDVLKKQLVSHFNTLDKRVTTTISKSQLVGTPERTSLANAWGTFDFAYENLIEGMNTAVTDGKVTTSEKSTFDSLYTTYITRLNILTQALEAAEKYITESIGGKITTMESSITSNSEAIELRVTRTEAETIANEAVDGISIGGRNLLADSDLGFHNLTLYSSNGGGTRLAITESGVKYSRITTTTNAYFNVAPYTRERVQGETYTLSFDYRTETSAKLYFYPSEHYTNWLLPSSAGVWKRASYTYTQTGETLPANDSTLFGVHSLADTTKPIDLRRMKLERGSKATDWTPAPEDLDEQLGGIIADTEEALDKLEDLADDSKLTATEKSMVKKEWEAIQSEKPTMVQQAAIFELSSSDYTAKYDLLDAYISPLLVDMSSTSDISTNNFSMMFMKYYDARNLLVKNIMDRSKGLIQLAQDDADTANNLLADISSDSKLSPVEKKSVKVEWDIIESEKLELQDQAAAYGVSLTLFTDAYSALETYLGPLLADLNTVSNIDSATFRGKFKAYYDARTALINNIITNLDGEIREEITNLDSAYSASLKTTADGINAEVEKRVTRGDMETYVGTEITATAEAIDLRFTEVNKSMGETGEVINEITAFFEFSAEGLDIGKSDSPLGISISNEQIDFKDNGVTVAYINGQKMYITDMDITSSAIIGLHKVEKYNNNLTLIQWVGD